MFSVFASNFYYRRRQRRSFLFTLALLSGLLLVSWLHPAILPAMDETDSTADRAAADLKPQTEARLAIDFSGNRALSDSTLRSRAAEELEKFARLNFREADAEDAAFEMELAYRSEGYAFAKVDYAIEKKDAAIRLYFTVQEGPRVIIKNILFKGNSATSSDELLARFASGENMAPRTGQPFVESAVDEAVSNIRDLYYARGFTDIRVGPPEYNFSADRSTVTIMVVIREGVRFIVKSIDNQGDIPAGLDAPLKKIEDELIGNPYLFRVKLALQNRIIELYGNHGFPDTDVRIKEEKHGTGDVALSVTIESGPQVTISGLRIVGNDKTREAFIAAKVTLRPGEPFNLAKKRASFRNLYRTGLFTRVDIDLEPDPENPARRQLLIKVEEAPSRELYGEVGWGSYELLRMKAGFKEKNLLGSGRSIRTEVGASFKNEEIRAAVTDPSFLDSEIRADLPVYFKRREEPSFIRQESGLTFNLSKSLQHDMTITTGYQYRRTSIRALDIDIGTEPVVTNDYNFASMVLQLSRDTRNDIFLPTSGYSSFIAGEYADDLLGSEVKLAKVTGGLRYFLPLRKGTVLGFRYDSGFVIPIRDQITIPFGERFYNGGENTVRSFRQDRLGPKDASGEPVGGNAYNVINVELRQIISRKFSCSLFYDLGNIAPNRTRIEEGKEPYTSRTELINDTFTDYFNGFRSAVGLGLQYLLPVGPARLDFAFNPDRDKNRHEDDLVIHFSIGMAF